VLEACVPYAEQALYDWLGCRPEQFCSERTAAAMAMVAYVRARRFRSLAASAWPVAGLACTASLASDRPKQGPHRAFIAVQTRERTCLSDVTLVKGRRTRRDEERAIADLILDAIAEASGIDVRLPLPFHGDEAFHCQATMAPTSWQELIDGETRVVSPDGSRLGPDRVAAVFPGAFNPLHDGHRRMVEIAAGRLKMPVIFEMSVENVDKPLLDYAEMARRDRQFAAGELWLTRAATFAEKARLFPGTTFVVGADTLRRIGDPKYYGGSEEKCLRSVQSIAQSGCRFLVFGRRSGERFETLADLRLPAPLLEICTGVDEEAFRVDLSSTELRKSLSD
jgi:hypothetical protein